MHTNFLLLITHKLQITLHSYKTSFRLQRNLQSSELHGYHPSMIASIREIADKQYPKLILKFSVEITATISNRINSSRTTVVHVIEQQHHHQVFKDHQARTFSKLHDSRDNSPQPDLGEIRDESFSKERSVREAYSSPFRKCIELSYFSIYVFVCHIHICMC